MNCQLTGRNCFADFELDFVTKRLLKHLNFYHSHNYDYGWPNFAEMFYQQNHPKSKTIVSLIVHTTKIAISAVCMVYEHNHSFYLAPAPKSRKIAIYCQFKLYKIDFELR